MNRESSFVRNQQWKEYPWGQMIWLNGKKNKENSGWWYKCGKGRQWLDCVDMMLKKKLSQGEKPTRPEGCHVLNSKLNAADKLN